MYFSKYSGEIAHGDSIPGIGNGYPRQRARRISRQLQHRLSDSIHQVRLRQREGYALRFVA